MLTIGEVTGWAVGGVEAGVWVRAWGGRQIYPIEQGHPRSHSDTVES